jgi:hypothetical protein
LALNIKSDLLWVENSLSGNVSSKVKVTTGKHGLYSILAVVSLLGLGITQSARANLITNGGFETGDFSGWTVFGPDNAVVGPTPFTSPHSGNFQALFGFGDNSISQNVTTTPGSFYVITFWLAPDVRQGGSPSVAVNWGGSNIFSESFTSPSGYTEHTFTVNASSPATQLQFQFSSIFGNVFYLDDISVTRAGVPDGGSTVSLLGLALFGVAVLRRKLRC